MSYGETLTQLSPCPAEKIYGWLSDVLPNEAKLVDIGCGRGELLQYLQAHTNYELFGCDADEYYVQVCTQACGKACTIVYADTQALPYQSAQLDAAVASCVLSLTETEQSIGEIQRILRQDGIFLLADLYARNGKCAIFEENSLIYRLYAQSDWEQLLLQGGFRILRFIDCSFDLQTMVGQMILDGTICEALSPSVQKLLRSMRPGYGVWIAQKRSLYENSI